MDNDNIVSFDDFSSEHQIGLHHQCLVQVVLEGRSDVDLFERFWFSDLTDTFNFVAAEDVVGGGGCLSVAPAVEHLVRVDGLTAIGIVDRDTLHSNGSWATLYELDNAAFRAAAHTPQIIVTTLWEVEAYLLEPDLIEHWVAGSHKKGPGPKALCGAAVGMALQECEILLNAAPYFSAMQAAGTPCRAGHFRANARDRIEQICTEKLARALPAHQAVAATVEGFVANLRAQLPADQNEQLALALRYVDTKRLIGRLEDALELHSESHWTMASAMKKLGRRPAELAAYLGEAARRAA